MRASHRGNLFASSDRIEAGRGSLFYRDQSLAVDARSHPEWDPLGIDAGGFVVFPSLGVGATFTDNVFSLPGGGRSDIYWTLRPALAVVSNWDRNALRLDANAAIAEYATYPSQNSAQYALTLTGQADARHDLALQAEISQKRILIPRLADAYATTVETPLLYDQTQAVMRVQETLRRLDFQSTTSVSRVNYETGTTFDGRPYALGFLDSSSVSEILRGQWAFSNNLFLFAQEQLIFSEIRGALRNHDETETLIGPNLQIYHLLTAEVGIGYLTSRYADPRARNVRTVSAAFDAHYFPTPLLTLDLKGQQGVVDSGLINTPAYLSRQVTASAEYELLRNLVIRTNIGAIFNRYEVIDRRDNDMQFGTGAVYKLTHATSVAISLQRVQRRSSGAQAARPLSEDTAGLTLTVRM